jgi:hypothetical protein
MQIYRLPPSPFRNPSPPLPSPLPVWSIHICLREHETVTAFSTRRHFALARRTMLQQLLGAPLRLSLLHPTTSAISCSAGRRRRRRRPRPKPIAFPPAPLRRFFSSSLRRLLPRPRPLTIIPGGGGWFGRRRKIPAEEALTLALTLALGGDRLAGLAEAWNASVLGQALGVWAAVMGRRRRRGGALRGLGAFLLGVAFCALVCHLRGAAFLEKLRKTAGGRKLVRIMLR